MLLCAQYILPVSSEPIIDGAVLVRDGVIRDIGKAEQLRLRYPEEEVVDQGLAAVMPGLVDLHTRLEQSVLRGVVNDAPYVQWLAEVAQKSGRMEASDWFDSAILGGLDALSSGITTVADITLTGASCTAVNKLGLRSVIYRQVGAMDKNRIDAAMQFAQKDILHWREEVDSDRVTAVNKLGLRSVIYRQVGAMDKNRIDAAMQFAQKDILHWREEVDSDRVTIGIAAAPLFTNHPAMLSAISKFALKEDLPVALWLAGSREESDFVRYGSSPFQVHGGDVKRGYVEIPPWLPTGVSPVRYALNWNAFDADNVMIVGAVYVDDEDLKKLRSHKLGLRSVIYRQVGAMDKNRIDAAMQFAQKDILHWREEVDSDRVTIGIAAAPLFTNHPAMLSAISKFAQKEDLPVALWLAGSREESDFVRYGSSPFQVHGGDVKRGYVEIPPRLPTGVSPVRYALNWNAFDADNVMIVGAVYVDDEDLKKLRSHDVAVCVCPRASAQLGMGVAPLDEYIRAGLRVGLGTDSPAATESTDMLSEMRLARGPRPSWVWA